MAKAHVIHVLGPDDTFALEFLKNTHYSFLWHYHPEYELIVPLQGSLRAVVGDHLGDFSPGGFYFVGPNLPHVFYSIDVSGLQEVRTAYVMRISTRHLEYLASEFSEARGLDRLLDDAAQGLLFTGRIYDTVCKKLSLLEKLPGMSALAGLLDILELMSVNREAQALVSAAYNPKMRGHDTERIDKVCNYLQQHYREDLALGDVAAHVNSSVSNLCAFFKKATGKTIIDYVNDMRISHACRLLGETDQPIAAVALESGYSTLSHFNRQFRKHKAMTPRAFRQAWGEPRG